MCFVEEKHCLWENQAVLHVLAIKVAIVWVTFSFCAYVKLSTMKETLNRSCQWWMQLFPKLPMVKATSLLWNWKKINETKCSLVWWFSIQKCHWDCWGLDFSIQILIIMLKLYLIQTQHLLYNGTTMESSTQMHSSFVLHMFLT